MLLCVLYIVDKIKDWGSFHYTINIWKTDIQEDHTILVSKLIG